MLTKENLKKLKFSEIQTIQMDANNPDSITCLESQLNFALCQIYATHTHHGIPQNVKAGFERIFNVWFSGKRYNSDEAAVAYRLLASNTFTENQKEIEAIMQSYQAIPKNERTPRTNVLLGILYYKDIFMKKDVKRGIAYFQIAANQNSPEAQFLMARLYKTGYPTADRLRMNETPIIPLNIEKEIQYIQKSAEQGFPPAQYTLGTYYLEGRGSIKKNLEMALACFADSQKNGDFRAKDKLLEVFSELETEDFDKGILTQRSQSFLLQLEASKNVPNKRNNNVFFSDDSKNFSNNNANCSNSNKRLKLEEKVDSKQKDRPLSQSSA